MAGLISTERGGMRAELEKTRKRTLALMAMVPDDDLTYQVHPFYSPIGWHMGHVAMVEEYWVLQQAFGLEPHNAELSFIFANIPDNPKSNRINLPRRDEIAAWMGTIRARALVCLEKGAGNNRLLEDDYCFKFAMQHEHQHQETIIELMQLLGSARLIDSEFLPRRSDEKVGETPAAVMVRIPRGEFRMGTDDLHAYDNEKQPHRVSVDDFYLSKYPVTVREWLVFIEDGGYHKPEYWPQDGWIWRDQERASAPEYWTQKNCAWMYRSPVGERVMNLDEPVASLSWFEADAFARWKGMRLPTEAEWEYAATFDPTTGECRKYPWGNEEPDVTRANHGISQWNVTQIGQHENGESAFGIQDMAGQVWEWTSSAFAPYQGFKPYPYEGYSYEHMDGTHKVLRGGSWASQPEILRCTFRNWYVPSYRQGLLGMRLAADA